jgi:hypothetical protein
LSGSDAVTLQPVLNGCQETGLAGLPHYTTLTCFRQLPDGGRTVRGRIGVVRQFEHRDVRFGVSDRSDRLRFIQVALHERQPGPFPCPVLNDARIVGPRQICKLTEFGDSEYLPNFVYRKPDGLAAPIAVRANGVFKSWIKKNTGQIADYLTAFCELPQTFYVNKGHFGLPYGVNEDAAKFGDTARQTVSLTVFPNVLNAAGGI